MSGSVPANWRGYPQHHEVAGGHVVRRRLKLNTGGTFVRVNARSTEWFGSDGSLTAAQVAAALARGVIKKLSIVFPPSSEADLGEEQAGVRADFNEHNPGSPGALEGKFNSASPNRALVASYPTSADRHDWWWRSVDGQVVVEVELVFDIPTE